MDGYTGNNIDNVELQNIRNEKNKLYTQLLILIKEQEVMNKGQNNKNKNNDKMQGGARQILSLKEAMKNSFSIGKKNYN